MLNYHCKRYRIKQTKLAHKIINLKYIILNNKKRLKKKKNVKRFKILNKGGFKRIINQFVIRIF